MRSTLLLVVAAASFGCSSNNNNGSMDMGVKKGDMAMHGPADLAAPAGCSVTNQDCGAGMKCVPTVQGSGQNAMIVGGCIADGTAAAGATCTPDTNNMTMFTDDYKAGLFCDNDNAGSTFSCKKFCASDAACGTGERCANFNIGVGVCLTTCTPFTTGACATGSDCGGNWDDIDATQTKETGFFTCKMTGAGAAFASCTVDSDCGANTYCDSFQQACTAICNATNACPVAPADGGTASCNPFSDENGAGYCIVM